MTSADNKQPQKEFRETMEMNVTRQAQTQILIFQAWLIWSLTFVTLYAQEPRSVSENPVVGPRASGLVTGKDGEAGDIAVYRRYSSRCTSGQSSRETSRSKPDRILQQAPKMGGEARLEAWKRHREMASSSPFNDLQWQTMGPKFAGGRIESIDAPHNDLKTYRRR